MKVLVAHAARNRERGGVTVIVLFMLPVLLAFIGIALDLNRVYSRKIELQTAADAMALAAAAKLDGTTGGLGKAQVEASGVAYNTYYALNKKLGALDPRIVTFAASASAADDDWKHASQLSSADAAKINFVRIDTQYLSGDVQPNLVDFTLAKLLPGVSDATLDVVAVAGQLETPVLPLAVCALNNTESGSHPNYNGVAAEKLEYGFRRGVSYNLLDQSPTTTARVFLVNPFDAGNGVSLDKHFDPEYIGPSMCAGTMAVGTVQAKGPSLHVKEIDPGVWGGQLATWLNSRFEVYSGANACERASAPPDTNVQEFTGDYMKVPPAKPTSATVARNATSRESVANLVSGDTTTDTVTEAGFGPLWVYTKPSKASGSGSYTVSQWPNMYKFGSVSVQASTTYVSTPYTQKTLAPTGGPGVAGRRVLNVPLLDCASWSGSGPAPVAGIGKFFMTAKADSTTIPGEFAGLLSPVKPFRTTVLFK